MVSRKVDWSLQISLFLPLGRGKERRFLYNFTWREETPEKKRAGAVKLRLPVLFSGAASTAAGAVAGTSAASGAAAAGAGFQQGAHCQKYDSGQYGQHDDVTHDSYLL